MHQRLLLAAFILSLASVSVVADTKTWQRNTNFDDPANWNGGGVICTNDRKVFPADMKASVFIQKNESLQELVLSNNMILTFGEGAMLTFNSNPSSVQSSPSQGGISSVNQASTKPPPDNQCTAKGRILEFIASASSWFDPTAWSTTNFQTKNDSRRFMLDLEKVPCDKDRVVFPAKNSFQVDMEGRDLAVGTMVIQNEELTSQEMFDKYWRTEKAHYDFLNTSTNNALSGERCRPADHCICSDRYSDEAKARVCKYLKGLNATASCSRQVSPTYGQCNPLCGATIDLIFNQTNSSDLLFLWEDIQSAILTALNKWPTVMYSIGPFKDRVVQITLKDSDGNGEPASSSVCDIIAQLKFNDTAYIQGITQVSFQRSVGVNAVESCFVKPTFAPWENNSGIDYVILGVALGIGVIFIILVAAGIAIYRRRYHGNLKTEMELGYMNNGNRLTSQGFDNPVYNSPLPFDDNFVISYETDNDQITGFENATYVPGPDVKPKKVQTPDKKVPLDDPGEPTASKKSKQKAKKSKEKASLGFDNPVYDIKDKENADSMVSVPLDEDMVTVPDQVEHDGVGFANPIATGLSESQMSPEPPKQQSLQKTVSKGIENPLYESPGGSQEAVSDGSTSPHEITVHTTTQSSKKKKAKKNKNSKSAAAADDGDLGFGNPMYGADSPMDFYQPDLGGDAGDFLPPED